MEGELALGFGDAQDEMEGVGAHFAEDLRVRDAVGDLGGAADLAEGAEGGGEGLFGVAEKGNEAVRVS